PPRSGEGEQRQPLPPAPSPKRRGGAKPLPPPSLLGKGAGGFGPSPPPSRVAALLAEEQHAGIEQAGYYGDFARRVERLKRDLRRLLAGLRRKGRTVAAYGASAKGSTLLNAFGIGRETIDFVADRSTVKQGKFTPGTRLPIVAPGELLRRMPDYVLLLTWNFADEILEQQAEYRQRGGKFILPVPEVRVV
ncbi:MAG TPA: methyltransferase C-terminal domain-containing protein, partial [Gemmataceae bacterium]